MDRDPLEKEIERSIAANVFDYSTKESREYAVDILLENASSQRSDIEQRWDNERAFYMFFRDVLSRHMAIDNNGNLIEANVPQELIGLSDAYIQVESQIEPQPPEFEFKGRDGRKDSAKAKQRQYVVQSIIDNNNLDAATVEHTRALGINGDSFFKVYFNKELYVSDGIMGDVCISPISIYELYIDPAAKNLDTAEFVDHVYFMHFREVLRVFGEDLATSGIEASSLMTEKPSERGHADEREDDYLIEIVEHYYKDDEGEIALSIQINKQEIRFVPKYWEKLHRVVRWYPFAHFYRIKALDELYSISEIEVIVPDILLVNGFLSAGKLNVELMSNDVWTVEEGTLEEGTEITNTPGEVIKYRQGANPPKRAGGINHMPEFIGIAQFFIDQIQRVTRNYDTNQGKETSKVTTASGLLQIRADSEEQQNTKRFAELQGWRRLYQLIDCAALEHYDEERQIFIGVPAKIGERGEEIDEGGRAENLDPKKGDIFFTFNSKGLISDDGYFPVVDCVVDMTSESQNQQNVTTLMQIAEIMQKATIQNYKIIVAAISRLKIKEKQEIIDNILDLFEPRPIPGVTSQEDQLIVAMLPPETQALLRNKPELLPLAKQLASMNVNPQANTMQQSGAGSSVAPIPQRTAGPSVKNPQGIA